MMSTHQQAKRPLRFGALSVFAGMLAACSADAPEPVRGGGAAAAAPTAAVGGGGTAAKAAGAGGATYGKPAGQGGDTAFLDDAGAVPECGRQQFVVEQKPADILLVLDRSGSMQNDVGGDDAEGTDASKWELVVPALKQVIAATNDAVAWGLSLFPAGDEAGECSDESYPKDIAVPVKANNAPSVNAAIDKATPDGDGTPTADAVDEALKYLQTVKDDHPKYILLATDGEPSCAGKDKGGDNAREAAVSAVERAAAAGVHTFVVGIATTKDSASKTLTELAKAGLEPPSSGYNLASNRAELVTALQRITASVASCRFPLSAAPPDPAHVGVLIGTQKIVKDTQEKNGWNFVGSDQRELQLFGAACDLVLGAAAADVNVVFGCKNDELF